MIFKWSAKECGRFQIGVEVSLRGVRTTAEECGRLRRISNSNGGLWGVPPEASRRSADECAGFQIQAEASGEYLQRPPRGVRTNAEDVKFERRPLGTASRGFREECGRVRRMSNSSGGVWGLEPEASDGRSADECGRF